MDRPPHLDIDLNEAPSPPPSPTPAPPFPLSPPREFAPPIFAPPLPPLPPPPVHPPPAPANAQAQLLLAHEAREIALRFHQAETLRVAAARALAAATGSSAGVPQPAQHPGEAGWGARPGHPPLPCPSCNRPEIPGATIVCDACERGFHESCVRVWPPLMSQPPPPPPPPGPPGVRRPPVIVNEDWTCPECEVLGARSTRWRLGAVPCLDINAAPPEDPVTVAVRDITRQLSQLPINTLLMIAAHLIIEIHGYQD